jgi:hypothetical protein
MNQDTKPPRDLSNGYSQRSDEVRDEERLTED